MRVRGDDGGAVLAEYALVLALLSVAFISGMLAIERNAASALSTSQTELLNYGLRNGS
jgi:Flp pilus assembly pilin Flp